MQEAMRQGGHRVHVFEEVPGSEKKKNPKLDDAAATKAAENRFLGTMWFLNSEVPSTVTDNLAQAHISGTNNYPKAVKQAFTVLSVSEKETSTATSLAQTYKPVWAIEGSGRSRGGRGGQGGPGRGAGGGGAGRGDAQPGRTNRCHWCSKGDHFFSDCPNPANKWGEVGSTEAANGKVSCNFNRCYDRVVTLA